MSEINPNETPPLVSTEAAPAIEPDLAQQSLQNALRGGFSLLLVIMVGLVLLYLGSGIFEVKAGEQGLIARFGELRVNSAADPPSPVYGPGWHFALPDPFDAKITLPQEGHTFTSFAFAFARQKKEVMRLADATPANGDQLIPGIDGAMLSGDKNLSHGVWNVQYAITGPEAFARNVGDRPEDFEPLLDRLLASSVMRVVASQTVEDVLIRRPAQVAEEVQGRLQREIDALELGISVRKVTAELIEPRPVKQAFTQVSQAENERESLISEARAQARETLTKAAGEDYPELLEQITAYGTAQALRASEGELAELRSQINDTLEQAGGEVAVLLRDARAERSAVRNRIQREYKEFVDYLAQYRQNPEVTTMRLWVRMLREVLGSKQNYVFLVPAESDPIEIIVDRDPQKRIEAERERVRTQLGGA